MKIQVRKRFHQKENYAVQQNLSFSRRLNFFNTGSVLFVQMTKICILLKLCTKHSLLETMQSIAKYFVPGPSPSPTASYEIENPVCALNIVEAYLSQRLYPNNVSWSFRPSPPKCSPELFEKKRSNTLLFSPYFINNLPF